ncbi:GpE family phage tail protein [Stenotrophomonas indicatrix]
MDRWTVTELMEWRERAVERSGNNT